MRSAAEHCPRPLAVGRGSQGREQQGCERRLLTRLVLVAHRVPVVSACSKSAQHLGSGTERRAGGSGSAPRLHARGGEQLALVLLLATRCCGGRSRKHGRRLIRLVRLVV